MTLNGIDISSWQSDVNLAKMTDTDFVIVKATGGMSYKNPAFAKHMSQGFGAGKLMGCYHFAYEATKGTAKQEAKFFCDAFKPYKGKAVPFLDWEADALNLPVSWAKEWLDYVAKETGTNPGIYMSKSVCRSKDWSSVAKTYPLWVAQYANNNSTGWQRKPWTDGNSYGAWKKPTIFQYSSSGTIKGYSGRLDINIYYGDAASWQAWAGASGSTPAPEPEPKKEETVTKLNRGQLAADIHKRMVEDDRFGYSWEERWGAKDEKWTVDGVTFTMPVGDYDCSSSSIQAWKKALTGTKYANKLDGATYTGNMRSVFTGSGLFQWKPISFIAHPGDLYLNEANHVAICQQQEPDELSEFSWGDNGAYGNKRGDQSGFEARVNPYYDYPWDGILHYTGKADSEIKPDPTPAPTPTPTPTPAPTYKKGKYKVLVNDLNVRAKASTKSESVAKYQKGQHLTADKIVTKNGYVWASYIGSSSGLRRYVAIATEDGKKKFMAKA